MPFENFDFTDFWYDSNYSKEEYICGFPTDSLIEKVEEELGYKLPESYIWLMKQHNGGIPVDTCFPCKESTSWAEDHVAITGIMGIGYKLYAICGNLGSRFMIEEWGYPDIGIAICDCPSAGHDMIFLDYRECGKNGEPKVVHIDQECDYRITFLADSFEEFICGLVNWEVYDTSEEEKETALEMVSTAHFSELLSELCNKCDEPVKTEFWIREISKKIVEDKGYFALHADENSMLLYDIQFWLYTNIYSNITEDKYLSEYSKMIAFGHPFGTEGYAASFVTDWLEQRKKEGTIIEKDNILFMSDISKRELLKKRSI